MSEELKYKAEKIIFLLEPCMKKGTGRHSVHYATTWGWKTQEGLRASILAILEEDTDPSEGTTEQEEEN